MNENIIDEYLDKEKSYNLLGTGGVYPLALAT